MEIANPEETDWKEYDLVVITVSDRYKMEIYSNLVTKYSLSKEKIVFAEETMILSSEEIYDAGNTILKNVIEDRKGIVTTNELCMVLEKNSMNDLEKYFFFAEHNPTLKLLHYFEAYDRFFSKYRGKDVTILEIGVYRGGSTHMWKNYFKNGNNKVTIYGIDIDPQCKALEDEDIRIFIGSQEDREFLKQVKEKIGKVDIVIDDGGHTMNQQITSFEELFDAVADDGIYLCEDLHTSYWKSYGGSYRGQTFMEYSKNLVDYIHAQYSETDELVRNVYSEQIRYISYCDSMVFIEKKKKSTNSITVHSTFSK